MGLNCDVIKDLMSLYVDDVCSEATKRIVDDHIEHCDSCGLMLRKMMKMEKEIETDMDNRLSAKNPLKIIRRRNRIFVGIAVIVTIAVMMLFIAVVQNVKPLYDIFFGDERVIVENTSAGQWQSLVIDEREYVKYDRFLSKKQIINDANSSGPIIIRITEKDGNVVITDLLLEPGEAKEFVQLKRNKEYFVEYQADEGWYCINFR